MERFAGRIGQGRTHPGAGVVPTAFEPFGERVETLAADLPVLDAGLDSGNGLAVNVQATFGAEGGGGGGSKADAEPGHQIGGEAAPRRDTVEAGTDHIRIAQVGNQPRRIAERRILAREALEPRPHETQEGAELLHVLAKLMHEHRAVERRVVQQQARRFKTFGGDAAHGPFGRFVVALEDEGHGTTPVEVQGFVISAHVPCGLQLRCNTFVAGGSDAPTLHDLRRGRYARRKSAPGR